MPLRENEGAFLFPLIFAHPMNFSPLKLFLLSLLSGLLLFAAWPASGIAPLIFIAWVPLLLLEQHFFLSWKKSKEEGDDTLRIIKKTNLKIFGYAYLAFFTWNVSTTWWIWNSTGGGAVMAIMANALLMALTFLFFHITKKRLDGKFSGLVLIAYWLTFEYIHMHWDLSWTWLTLGNVFSTYFNMVQWYEYTGVFGGSLWVLAVNLLLLGMLTDLFGEKKKLNAKRLVIAAALLLLPIGLSCLLRPSAETISKMRTANVVVVQPNIDPYNEKFSGNYQEQLEKMLKLASARADSTTDLIAFPETAIQEGMWEDQMRSSGSVETLLSVTEFVPNAGIVIGASTARAYKPGEEISSTARKMEDMTWYDDYNTALFIDHTGNIQVYHKSILVPGVEKMPFPKIFGWLENLAIKMGGTSGSLGTQEERTVFLSGVGKKLKIAPVICYESIYGGFVRQYVKNGADIICIITNDGWWGDTPGYRQHLSYASLRAIETRTGIARSANTGISCFIAPDGTQYGNTNWWEPIAIKGKVALCDHQTFYVRFGDYIAIICCALSALFACYGLFLRSRDRYRNRTKTGS